MKRFWPPPLRILLPATLLFFSAVAGFITHRYARHLSEERVEANGIRRVEMLGTQLATMCSYMYENGPMFGVERQLGAVRMDRDINEVLVFGDDNRVLAATPYDLLNAPLENTPAAGSTDLLRRAREANSGKVEVSSDRTLIHGAFPFPILRKTGGSLKAPDRGTIYLQYDLRQRRQAAALASSRELRAAVLAVLGGCGAICALIVPLLTWRVRQLRVTARQLAAGDLTARAQLHGADEMAELAAAFDHMADDLQRRNTELRETEARFRFLVEGIPQVFWLMELEPERFLYVGNSFGTIWQRSVTDLMARPEVWIESVHPDDRHRAAAAFLAWITGRAATYDETYRIVRPEGEERWIRDRGVRMEPSADGRKRVAGLAEDITRQRQKEVEEAELERKLQETQKLESLGVLAGGIAHDFNNLLAGILGNAALAREEIPPSSDLQPYLEHIESAAVRASELCKQMLAYSGRGRFELQRVDLSELVRETTQLIQLSISKSVVLRFDLVADLPSIEVDPSQIRQVIMNLVINASEAIGSKSGVIGLNTGIVQIDREYLERAVLSPTLPDGTYVYLEVSDDGAGMSAETQARIFEPFFTTKFAGRGLGLSAVLGIVRGHRGAMRVYSEEGRGTTFKLIFPAVGGEPQALDGEYSAESWTASGLVLVVDDDETVRQVSSRIVQKLGFEVITANDGREGVDLFRPRSAEVVVVLMDLTMPYLDGEQAFREIRAIRPDAKVILMSGFSEQDAVNRFAGKGLAGFIQKPFRPDALRRKLREVVQSIPGAA